MEMDISSYRDLILSFVRGDISVPEFERDYLRLFKNDQRSFPQEIYEILNKLFTDVDAFCSDDSLRGVDGLNEAELKECARRASEELKAL